MNETNDAECWFRRAAIGCAIAFVVPVAIYVATHKLHPANVPGGFGEGYANMYDALRYSIIVVPAFIGLLISTIGWIVVVVSKGK